MKKLLVLMMLCLAGSAFAEAEMKKVCNDVVKKGKTVQECKTIKVHKKVEGEVIPDAKKKK